jgi:hypothetical protein
MNDEIRMSNAETNSNEQNPKSFAAIAEPEFVIRALSFVRNSLFVILHF